MCRNAYEQISPRTGKTMIFCRLMDGKDSLSQLCISQRFCSRKDRYVETDSKRNCKYYIE